MKKTLQIVISLFVSSVIVAQEPHIQPCNTYAAMEQYFDSHPSSRDAYEKEQAKLDNEYLNYVNGKTMNKTAATQYTIPVVFHILHTYGPENVSDATIMGALAQINSDYAKAGSDVSTISPLFSSLYINSDIVFMLAHKDPNGNCTSGIVHHYDTRTTWDQSNTSYYAYTWNPTKYLNIYIVKSICQTLATCSPTSIIVGYTYRPGSFGVGTGSPLDAIVYDSQFLTGTSARSLSHEIGHWLNLKHTFGNTNNPGTTCGDDGIADTPPTKGYFSTCPSSSGGNTCSGSGGNANVENIMDYSGCPKMFTTGQTNVMRTALASATNGRNNLSTTANLLATDVNGTSFCAPVSDISPITYTVCSGQPVYFYDVSYNGPVTYRNWTAASYNLVGSPTLSTTTIIFPYAGVETISLTVGNSTGTTTSTRMVTVLDGKPNIDSTFIESFEAGVKPLNWNVDNTSGGVAWALTSAAAATGSWSYYLNNFNNNPNGAVDILETPSYNFASDPNSKFTFKYAYAKKDAANNDVFKVQASKDCGGTWTDIYVPSNSSMATGSGGILATPFVPTPSQFKTYTLTNHPGFGPFTVFTFRKMPLQVLEIIFT